MAFFQEYFGFPKLVLFRDIRQHSLTNLSSGYDAINLMRRSDISPQMAIPFHELRISVSNCITRLSDFGRFHHTGISQLSNTQSFVDDLKEHCSTLVYDLHSLVLLPAVSSIRSV